MKTLFFYTVLILTPVSVAAAGVAWYGMRVTKPYVNFAVKLYGDNDIVFDRELGFVRPRRARTRRVQRDIDYTIYTDGRGARVNGPMCETPEHVDILTVGCSFSEGHGFANEATFTESLGRTLGVPVANFAIGSYSGLQAALSLERHASLAPRVIVYGMIEDHLRRNLEPCAPNFFPNCLQVPIVIGTETDAPSFTTVDGTGFDGIELTADLMKLREHPTILNRSLLGLRTAYHEMRDWKTSTVLAAASRLTEPNKVKAQIVVLQRMAGLARRLNATLIVLHMTRVDGLTPDDTSRGWHPLPQAVRDGVPEGVVFLDTSENVKAFYRRHAGHRLYLSPSDDHPNAAAHALFAGMLRDAILDRHLLAPALRATSP